MIKSVITAAGKGTRLLPITKELPKEMMPIFSKIYGGERVVIPVLQYIFEQLYVSNLRDYCFVVGREKRSIEDHFTPHESYVKEIAVKDRAVIESFYKRLENSHLIWVNQNKPRGFGDAVLRTERYVNNDEFVVHAGDVVIAGKTEHPISRMIKIAKIDSSIDAILLCKKVSDTERYGVPKIKKIAEKLFEIDEVEEKPSKPKSSYGLLPVYFFKPSIFTSLKKIKPGKGNEYQLTDAIQNLIETGHRVVAIPLNANEYELDVGTVESYKKSLDLSYKIA